MIKVTMKKFIYSLSIMMSAMTFTGCSDFFDPETDDQLNGEDYIRLTPRCTPASSAS